VKWGIPIVSGERKLCHSFKQCHRARVGTPDVKWVVENGMLHDYMKLVLLQQNTVFVLCSTVFVLLLLKRNSFVCYLVGGVSLKSKRKPNS
jgi:hypothetical protein